MTPQQCQVMPCFKMPPSDQLLTITSMLLSNSHTFEKKKNSLKLITQSTAVPPINSKIHFQNENLTWNTDQPDFTPCFQTTILVWVPCGIFWIILPLYLHYLSNISVRSTPPNILNATKTVCLFMIRTTQYLNMDIF